MIRPVRMPRVRGFTLIELLVVISVIMILAALTLPVISRAIRQGERATCTNNLRQIHAMALIYAKDYHQLLPYLDPGTHSLWIANKAVVQMAKRYNFQPQVYYCPSNQWDLIYKNFGANQWSLVNNGASVRFGYIHLSQRAAYNGTLDPSVELLGKIIEIEAPSLTPYYVDFISLNNDECYPHRTGGNILMIGGSVQWRTESHTRVLYIRQADGMMPYTEFNW